MPQTTKGRDGGEDQIPEVVKTAATYLPQVES